MLTSYRQFDVTKSVPDMGISAHLIQISWLLHLTLHATLVLIAKSLSLSLSLSNSTAATSSTTINACSWSIHLVKFSLLQKNPLEIIKH